MNSSCFYIKSNPTLFIAMQCIFLPNTTNFCIYVKTTIIICNKFALNSQFSANWLQCTKLNNEIQNQYKTPFTREKTHTKPNWIIAVLLHHQLTASHKLQQLNL